MVIEASVASASPSFQHRGLAEGFMRAERISLWSEIDIDPAVKLGDDGRQGSNGVALQNRGLR
jgi:hypothetical protein